MQRVVAVADPACLAELHEALDRLWAEAPEVDDGTRAKVVTALAELVGNVVEHGRTATGSTPRLEVELTVADDAVRALVHDDGEAVDPDVTDRGLPDDPLAESGRGLPLARAAADELAYDHGADGNRWRIVVRLAP